MNALHVIILALATWRCASLLAAEDGPFEVFGKLRHVLGVRYDAESNPYGTNWFAKGVCCVWCNGMWFATLWTIAYIVCKDSVWVALPLALSAVAIVIQEKVGE